MADSEVFNIGLAYSFTHVLDPLRALNEYITIAKFGALEFNDQVRLRYYPQELAQNRFDALERLQFELYKLLDNTEFVIRKKDKKGEKYAAIRKKLDTIILSDNVTLKKVTQDERNNSQTISINEKLFMEDLIELQKILRELKEPLNDAHLIFPPSDYLDKSEIMTELIEDG